VQVTGVRDFRNRAPELVAGDDLVFITRHGKTHGHSCPRERTADTSGGFAARVTERIGEVVSEHLESKGISEKEIIRDFKAWRKKASVA